MQFVSEVFLNVNFAIINPVIIEIIIFVVLEVFIHRLLTGSYLSRWKVFSLALSWLLFGGINLLFVLGSTFLVSSVLLDRCKRVVKLESCKHRLDHIFKSVAPCMALVA